MTSNLLKNTVQFATWHNSESFSECISYCIRNKLAGLIFTLICLWTILFEPLSHRNSTEANPIIPGLTLRFGLLNYITNIKMNAYYMLVHYLSTAQILVLSFAMFWNLCFLLEIIILMEQRYQNLIKICLYQTKTNSDFREAPITQHTLAIIAVFLSLQPCGTLISIILFNVL